MSGRPLTKRDLDLLAELEYFNRSMRRSARPLDLGGGSRSHHSATLLKLSKRGLVLRKNWALGEDGRRHGVRGSCVYWIADPGRAILASTNSPDVMEIDRG